MADQSESPQIEMKVFLESTPPGKIANISNLSELDRYGRPGLVIPEIALHCENESCSGSRFFKCEDSPHAVGPTTLRYNFLLIGVEIVNKAEKSSRSAQSEIKRAGGLRLNLGNGLYLARLCQRELLRSSVRIDIFFYPDIVQRTKEWASGPSHITDELSKIRKTEFLTKSYAWQRSWNHQMIKFVFCKMHEKKHNFQRQSIMLNLRSLRYC